MDASGDDFILSQLNLSGEPIIPELQNEIGNPARPPLPLPAYYNLSLALARYRELYQAYWTNQSETIKSIDSGCMLLWPENCDLN